MKKLLVVLAITACGSEPEAPPPPVGPSPTMQLPTSEESSEGGTTEAAPECPWDGMCASLECNGLCGPGLCDLPCRDGVRCIDTELDAGILCDPGGSSSSDSGTETMS